MYGIFTYIYHKSQQYKWILWEIRETITYKL